MEHSAAVAESHGEAIIPVANGNHTPTPTLAAKLARVMGKVGWVKKDGKHGLGYNYATEAAIVESVRNELSKEGIVFLPSVEELTREKLDGRKETLTTARMTMRFIDGESGETLTSVWFGEGADSGDKGAYKAYTGALKYCLLKTFLIPTGDDPEADNGNGNGSKPQQGQFKSVKPVGQDEPALATDAQIKALNTAGMKMYRTKEIWDTERPRLCAYVSNERTKSSRELTAVEMSRLIGKIDEALGKESK